jgi:hypothetical protein
MKPHIWKRDGWWYCSDARGAFFKTMCGAGTGRTPLAAWRMFYDLY